MGRPRSPTPSPGAIRNRSYRRRKQGGLKSVRVVLGEAEVDMLIARQFLEPAERDDSVALGDALDTLIYDVMVASRRHPNELDK